MNLRRERPSLRYLEIGELSHLLLQRRSNTAPFTHKNWRESYYFNATDEKKQLSLITTIGILPNRRRSSGFVIIIHKGKIALAKLLITRDIKWHETDSFCIRGLTYNVEGIDWHLGYRSKKYNFNMLFRPINEFYQYNKEDDQQNQGNSRMLFSQHIEQAGIFKGEIELNGNRIGFGPSPGHRDHSWGVRSWSSIDSYWLFSCTLGKDRAFNLWKGSSQGKPFQSGYYFDSKRNLKILSSEIRGQDTGKMGEPGGSEINFWDEEGEKHEVKCQVICSVPIPLPGSIVYETIAKIRLDNRWGFGLLERHVHDTNPFHKIRALYSLQKRRGRH
ncbi:MAG: hypothetical protein JSV09_04895 [Thermoplasmata archaeon]|nr:MAG: hypothetical protein JSV09_04895 [Thermoplasmata archaeon]